MSQTLTLARALRLAGHTTHGRYWSGRATLLTDPRSLDGYERAFALVEAALGGDPFEVLYDESGDAVSHVVPAIVAANDRTGESTTDQRDVRGMAASAGESLRHRRFAEASADELAQILRIVDTLTDRLPMRRSRRRRSARRGRLDVGRTLTASLATHGEPFDLVLRGRRQRPVKVVLLIDVSGSMAVYARVLLHFAVAWRRAVGGAGSGRVEVFAFATRLTRLSQALARRNVDDALAAAAAEVVDWDSGTTIGRCLDELVRVWGPRGVLSGAYVIIASDGLDRGDADLLAATMRRLKAAARHLVWVNPLAGDDRFVPIQRGMAAALPSVEAVVAGDNLASLEALATALRRDVVPPGGRVGRQAGPGNVRMRTPGVGIGRSRSEA